MYDNHIYCKEYRGLKDTIINIMNGDDLDTDIEKLEKHIYQLYDEGEMSSSQYDDLMRCLQELM